MAHGQADFGKYQAKSTISSMADNAELATRLGSIVNYDRRGDVIFLEDYDSPVGKFVDASFLTGEVMLGSESVLSGSQALKFVTGAVADHDAECYQLVPVYDIGRHGIKVSVSPYELSDFDSYYRIWAAIEDGTNQHFFGVRVNPFAHTLEYYNNAGGWTTFSTTLYLDTDYPLCFHNIKLVTDLTTGYYVRLMINDLEWDMSAYQFWKRASLTIATLLIYFTVHTEAGDVLSCWQDNFIYTINEP